MSLVEVGTSSMLVSAVPGIPLDQVLIVALGAFVAHEGEWRGFFLSKPFHIHRGIRRGGPRSI